MGNEGGEESTHRSLGHLAFRRIRAELLSSAPLVHVVFRRKSQGLQEMVCGVHITKLSMEPMEEE